jgi:hypothetical protein
MPMSDSAARTSSSLNGFIIALTIFTSPPDIFFVVE